MSFDPWSKESIELPDEFLPPAEPAGTNEQFVTLSLKLIYAEVKCCFGHWRDVDIPPGPYVVTDDGDEQVELYKMMKHLSSVLEGTRMVMERIMSNLSPGAIKQLVLEKAEEEHGVEFEAEEVVVGGKMVGLALRAKDPESGVEEITQWLNQGG